MDAALDVGILGDAGACSRIFSSDVLLPPGSASIVSRLIW